MLMISPTALLFTAQVVTAAVRSRLDGDGGQVGALLRRREALLSEPLFLHL